MTHAITAPRTATRIGVLFAAILLCLMTVFGVSGAQAHDELIASTPANGEVLKTAPKSLVLTFSGDIKKIGTILELTSSEGADIATDFSISGREVAITPAETLDNGGYTLIARVVSSDGHPIDKKIAFEVNDPTAAASSSSAASAPPATPAEPSAEADKAAETGTPVESMPAGLVWTIAGIAGLGLIAVVLLKARRQTR